MPYEAPDGESEMTGEQQTTSADVYFDLQANWGVTKHLGDRQSTRELAAQCEVNRESYILIVGCGVGVSACYLSELHGCRVMGIDISQAMVDRSIERAKKMEIQHRVQFQQADAQGLPFEDSVFDVVLCESVNAFIPDQKKAVSQYVRVVKPGGDERERSVPLTRWRAPRAASARRAQRPRRDTSSSGKVEGDGVSSGAGAGCLLR